MHFSETKWWSGADLPRSHRIIVFVSRFPLLASVPEIKQQRTDAMTHRHTGYRTGDVAVSDCTGSLESSDARLISKKQRLKSVPDSLSPPCSPPLSFPQGAVHKLRCAVVGHWPPLPLLRWRHARPNPHCYANENRSVKNVTVLAFYEIQCSTQHSFTLKPTILLNYKALPYKTIRQL